MRESAIDNSPENLSIKVEKNKSTLSPNPGLKAIEQDSPIATYTCSQDGNILEYNNAAAVLWGRHPVINEEKWNGAWKAYYPDWKPLPLEESPVAMTLKTGRPLNGNEIIIERPDNSFRYLLEFPHLLFNEKNIVTGAHTTVLDITSQKENEEKQSVLSAIVESSSDAIISKNLDGIIMSWNAGAEKLLGYKEDEIIGKNVSILFSTHLQQEEDNIIENIKNGKTIDHYETIRLHKNGSEVHLSLTVSPIKNYQGEIIGASKIARSIADRLLKEQIIKQGEKSIGILNALGKVISEKLNAQAILQQVVEAAAKITGAEFGAIFYNTVDEDGNAVRLFSLTGIPKEAFEVFGIPRNVSAFHRTYKGEGVERINDTRLDHRYGQNFAHYGLPPGYLPVVSYLAVPVISASGILIGELSFGHSQPEAFKPGHEDIVASIASQAALALENFKLFAEVKTLSSKKDEFIALASHELKTPLTTIKGYLQIIQADEKKDNIDLFIKRALGQVAKLNLLVSDLFDISKIEAGKLRLNIEEFGLYSLLKEIIETLHCTIKTHQIILEGQEVFINADKQRVEQVIINLLTNAVKYSPRANTVSVQLEPFENSVLLKIKDQGIGLTPEQQDKIFTRFYRAEGTQHIPGLGLGLYITKDIIMRHNGEIIVHSEQGKGCEFLISLPVKHAG